MKILKRILFFAISLFIVFGIYLEFGGNYILNKNDKRIITFNVRNTEKLPENVTTFYNTIYKNSLSKNLWNFYLASNSSPKDCPCHQMAHKIMPQLGIKNKSGIDYILVTRYIEHNFTQTECLNFNLNTFDFLENRKGIQKVSKSLFNKTPENLEPIEIAEIFAIYEKPVKNNRNRNPENAKKRSAYFHHLYLQNLSK
ncbi:transglycosylase domain-containing protein [Chryseobacterium sp. 2TAF14]